MFLKFSLIVNNMKSSFVFKYFKFPTRTLQRTTIYLLRHIIMFKTNKLLFPSARRNARSNISGPNRLRRSRFGKINNKKKIKKKIVLKIKFNSVVKGLKTPFDPPATRDRKTFSPIHATARTRHPFGISSISSSGSGRALIGSTDSGPTCRARSPTNLGSKLASGRPS